jgi:uncharacterized protein YjbI with pentapeptide repeats
MNLEHIEQELFTKQDYTETPLNKGVYENCNFRNCIFTGTDLSGIRFVDCTFAGCDLSNAKLTKTSLQETRFKDCKMLGFHFNSCDQLGLTVRFENCQLDHSSFYQVKLNHTIFQNCSLREVDFTESDLRNVILDECDLLGATFDHTNLERANLSTALNYSIDPENNPLRGARFSMPSVLGLLHKYQIEVQ